MTKEETQAIFGQQHKQWLHEPITRAFTSALEKHEAFIADKIASQAMDRDVTPEHIRLLAAQLSTIKHVRKLTHDTTTFTAKCSAE